MGKYLGREEGLKGTGGRRRIDFDARPYAEGTFLLMEPTAADYAELADEIAKIFGDKGADPEAIEGTVESDPRKGMEYMARIFVAVAAAEDGSLLYTKDDIPELVGHYSPSFFKAAVDKIGPLVGLGSPTAEDDEVDEQGNPDGASGDDSDTDSSSPSSSPESSTPITS